MQTRLCGPRSCEVRSSAQLTARNEAVKLLREKKEACPEKSRPLLTYEKHLVQIR